MSSETSFLTAAGIRQIIASIPCSCNPADLYPGGPHQPGCGAVVSAETVEHVAGIVWTLAVAPWTAHIRADHEVLRAVWALAGLLADGPGDESMHEAGQAIRRTMKTAGALPWPGARSMSTFDADVQSAAIAGDRDDAYAALDKIAVAAGCLAETYGATSITEVGDMIAAVVGKMRP